MNVRELARQAGLSHMTVSRALNGSPHVAPETRRRVVELAETLGYAIHGPARGLATGTTGTIGVLYPYHSLRRLESWYTQQLMHDVRLAVEQLGMDTIIAGYDTASRGQQDVARLCSQRKVDAVVVIGYEVTREALASLARGGYRYLCVNPPNEPWIDGHPAILVNQDLGGELAAQLLIDRECTSVAVIHEDVPQFRFRVSGFEQRWGARAPAFLLADGTEEAAYELATARAEELGRFDGIFVGSDVSAIGVLNGLLDSGVRVPGQTAIVGFDDITGATYCRPPLTTIHQPRVRVSEAVAQWLLSGDESFRRLFDPTVVLRGTA